MKPHTKLNIPFYQFPYSRILFFKKWIFDDNYKLLTNYTWSMLKCLIPSKIALPRRASFCSLVSGSSLLTHFSSLVLETYVKLVWSLLNEFLLWLEFQLKTGFGVPVQSSYFLSHVMNG